MSSERACWHCIRKKRKCDHETPCGACKKLDQNCEYPPPQSRRGPITGQAKKAETRLQTAENALWFVLRLPGVAEAVEAAVEQSVATGDAGMLPIAPTAFLEARERAIWRDKHRFTMIGDMTAWLEECQGLETAWKKAEDKVPNVEASGDDAQKARDAPAVTTDPILTGRTDPSAAPAASYSQAQLEVLQSTSNSFNADQQPVDATRLVDMDEQPANRSVAEPEPLSLSDPEPESSPMPPPAATQSTASLRLLSESEQNSPALWGLASAAIPDENAWIKRKASTETTSGQDSLPKPKRIKSDIFW